MKAVVGILLLGIMTLNAQSNVPPDHTLDILSYRPTPPRPEDLQVGVLPPGGIAARERQVARTSDLAVRLLSLDKVGYGPGDAILYEVLVKNNGPVPFVLPWSPDINLFRSEWAAPTLLEGSLFLEVRNQRSQRLAWLDAQVLLGSPSNASSLLTLRPAETALLRVPGVWRASSVAELGAMLATPNGQVKVAAILQVAGVLSPSANEIDVRVQK